ncbi:MAG: hypothetical protein NTX61_06595 [Bacteroidetes bacterium]|nr:hypothetical protein [Bacteroidota bacterium]
MKLRSVISLLVGFILFFTVTGVSQYIYVPFNDPGLEELLDELNSEHVFILNTVVKPYSRKLVAEKLAEALSKDSLLSRRQLSEIHFYLKNFRQEVRFLKNANNGSIIPSQLKFYLLNADPVNVSIFHNSFTFSYIPLIDARYYLNKNASVYSIKSGGAISAYFGKHIGIAAGIYKQFANEILVDPEYFEPGWGGNWNHWAKGGGTYIDWFGQLTFSWKWGMIGIFKDRLDWGNNYHGANIFTSKPPSFPSVRIHLFPAKWIEFNYFHGWLSSGVIDSNLTFHEHNGLKTYYQGKYIAANLLTVTPWKYLHISLGNSIIYDGNLQPAYLIPILFFKSVDHTLSATIDNENSQMFLDISSCQIKHLHLFLTLFVDELKLSRIMHKDQHNFLSWKGGLKIFDLPVQNLSVTIEGTRTLPITYQHYFPTLTFETKNYNFGNYLRDNSQEIYFEISFKPIQRLNLELAYNYAEHGDNFKYGQVTDPTVLPVFKNISWKKKEVSFTSGFDLLSNLHLFLTVQYRETTGETRFIPPLYYGTTATMSLGFLAGF